MRRALAALGLTVTALIFVLRFNPQEGVTFTAAAATTPTTVPSANSITAAGNIATTTTTTAHTQASTTTTEPPTTTTTTSATRVVDGPVVNTSWGPVQVEVTLQGPELIDVEALQVPNHASRSRQINDFVTPIYRQAALEAQSADFWGVSGATVTWFGYVKSLQAALDTAAQAAVAPGDSIGA